MRGPRQVQVGELRGQPGGRAGRGLRREVYVTVSRRLPPSPGNLSFATQAVHCLGEAHPRFEGNLSYLR